MALLEVSNLGIAFGGLQAVAQLDLSIEKGHLYGLIGPNGAGKRTLPARTPSLSASPVLHVPSRISACSMI